MDAGAADPLRAARPEEGEEKPKPTENQDDGYETSNSGEAARRKPSSAEGSPAPPAPPSPAPDPPDAPAPPPDHEPPYEPMMRPYQEPEPDYSCYRHFEPPPPLPAHVQHAAHAQHDHYQHFPFKYAEPYAFKREPDAPYDMTQHHHYQKREDDMYNGVKRECEDPYSFVEEEGGLCAMLGQPPMHHDPHAHHAHQLMLQQPKKRGRKKKIKDENGFRESLLDKT